MQRLTLLACLLAALGALAFPALAAGPAGWHEGTGVEGSFTVLRAVSPSLALAGGFDGALLRTDDGGQTWSATGPGATAALRDVASSDGQTIFTLDDLGGVRRSRDAGATWETLVPSGGMHPVALSAWAGGHLLLVGARTLLLSGDDGDSFTAVTPKLARGDVLRAGDRAGGSVVAWGSHTLLLSDARARSWKHMRLPGLDRGDSLIAADFVAPRVGFVLTSFRHLYRTRDAGHHWTDLLGTGGAGADIAFSDARHGFLAAPGYANRFDGDVLHTVDGGETWRPQAVAPRFLSKVATAGGKAYAIANEGSAMFATGNGGESGRAITVGFRPVPRRAHRGATVTIRGRLAPGLRGVGVAVSMRSSSRWIVRYVTTRAGGVYVARFKVQRRAVFVAQVASGAGHGSAAAKPVVVPVAG